MWIKRVETTNIQYNIGGFNVTTNQSVADH